jgi:hypothetical protein
MSAEEFKEFAKTLQEKLPVTFRINQTEVYHEAVSQMFCDPKFIEKYYQEPEDVIQQRLKDGGEDLKNKQLDLSEMVLSQKKYYPPGDVLFELTVPRELLKKNVGLKAIHKLV